MPILSHHESTLTLRLDDRQFAALLHVLAQALTGDDPAKLAALTTKLKSSAESLAQVVANDQPKSTG